MSISLGRPGTIENSCVTDEVRVNGAVFNITFDVNKPTQRFIHQQLQSGYCYESESTAAIVRALKPGDTFFDVGANCGWFSAVAAACGASVCAFEPDPENCASLRENCPTATVIEAAVCNRSGEAKLYVNLDNDGGHALWPCGLYQHNTETSKAGHPTRSIATVQLDDFKEHAPSVIKIDTEGAECNVLLGAEQVLLNKSLRLVVCERHPLGLGLLRHTPEEVEAIMTRHGFTWDKSIATNVVNNWIFTR